MRVAALLRTEAVPDYAQDGRGTRKGVVVPQSAVPKAPERNPVPGADTFLLLDPVAEKLSRDVGRILRRVGGFLLLRLVLIARKDRVEDGDDDRYRDEKDQEPVRSA